MHFFTQLHARALQGDAQAAHTTVCSTGAQPLAPDATLNLSQLGSKQKMLPQSVLPLYQSCYNAPHLKAPALLPPT